MSSHIKVYCRVKPTGLSPSTPRNGGNVIIPSCIKTVSQTQIMLTTQSQSNSAKQKNPLFTFDSVFSEANDQKDLFEQTTAPLIEKLMEGFNATILAYGQTNSGKTFTLLGDKIQSAEITELSGIVMRSIRSIFEEVEKRSATNEFKIKVSFFEIYNEKLKDLIGNSAEQVQIREKQDEIFLENLVEKEVDREEKVLELLVQSLQNRSVFATKMNDNSSRSHFVFQLVVERKDPIEMKTFRSKLFMIDLAGSEKLDKTKVEGKSLDEARSINKSLSELGNVISALSGKESRKEKNSDDLLNKTDYLNVSFITEYSQHDYTTTSRANMVQRDASPSNEKVGAEINENAKAKPHHVPYRNSKLTRLLQHSLGGNSFTSLIITVSGELFNESETLSSLRFGKRAKKIKNEPIIRALMSEHDYQKAITEKDALIAELRKKIAALEKAVPYSEPISNPRQSMLTLQLPRSTRHSRKDSSAERNSIQDRLEQTSKSRDRHLHCMSNASKSRERHTNCVGHSSKSREQKLSCVPHLDTTRDRKSKCTTHRLLIPSPGGSPKNLSILTLIPNKKTSPKSEVSKTKKGPLESIDVCEKIQDTMQHINEAIVKTLEGSAMKIEKTDHSPDIQKEYFDDQYKSALEAGNQITFSLQDKLNKQKATNSLLKNNFSSLIRSKSSKLQNFLESVELLTRRISQLNEKVRILKLNTSDSKAPNFGGINLDLIEPLKMENKDTSLTSNNKLFALDEASEVKDRPYSELNNTPLPMASPNQGECSSKQKELLHNVLYSNKTLFQRSLSLNPFPMSDSRNHVDFFDSRQNNVNPIKSPKPGRCWAIEKVEYAKLTLPEPQPAIVSVCKIAESKSQTALLKAETLKRQIAVFKLDLFNINQSFDFVYEIIRLTKRRISALKANRAREFDMLRNFKETNQTLLKQLDDQKDQIAILDEKNTELSKSIAVLLTSKLKIDLPLESNQSCLQTSDKNTHSDELKNESALNRQPSQICLDSLPLVAEFVKRLLEEIASLSCQFAFREQSHQKEILERNKREVILWKIMREHLTPEQILMTNYFFEVAHLEKVLTLDSPSEDCRLSLSKIVALINSYSIRFADLRSVHE